MPKWVSLGTRVTEEERATFEDYRNKYNTLHNTSFTSGGFIRFLLGKNAEIFNKKHPQ